MIEWGTDFQKSQNSTFLRTIEKKMQKSGTIQTRSQKTLVLCLTRAVGMTIEWQQLCTLALCLTPAIGMTNGNNSAPS